MLRRPLLGLVAVMLVLPGACADEQRANDGTRDIDVDALQSVEDCLHDNGLGANDITMRYETEPAFKRGLDACTDDAGVTVDDVLYVQRWVNNVHAAHLKKLATCMHGLGHPLEVYVLDDGSANLGDLDRYFTPDTLDEFFDDYAECDGGSRADLPTEAGMERDRKKKASQ